MVQVKKLGIVLQPTQHHFENLAVLNPGIYQDGNKIHMFYRAIDKEQKSCIGYALFEGPTKLVERHDTPLIHRDYDYESMGVEDPRIVKIGETYYLTYVAHDGKNALTAYATSSDLKNFKKQGIISPQITYVDAEKIFRDLSLKDSYSFFAAYYEKMAGENTLIWEKDIFFFDRQFNGRYALIHRILPDIQIAFFDDFKDLKKESFWKKYLQELPKHVLLENKHWFESRNIGGGCPPIETENGWILIFHAVEARNVGRVYHACAALLDKNNPLKVIGRLHEPLMSPTEAWEQNGFVANVVFPTGTAVFDDKLYIYYGAADNAIAIAEVSKKELIEEMLNPAHKHVCYNC